MSQHKYGAKPTTVDNIRFASQKEMRRYQELKLLEKAGLIRDLTVQPSFRLEVPTAGDDEHIGEYRADFQYRELQIDEGGFSGRWRLVIEDVKGFKTPLYRWKKKHVEAQYGITIFET